MTVIGTSLPRRLLSPGRRAALAVAVGAGVIFTPLPALASAGPVGGVSAPAVPVVAPTHAAQVVVDTAMAQLGKPYAWGSAGPSSFDCSGLTIYAYRAVGVFLPHSAAMQSGMGVPVAPGALRPGDLVSFYGGGHVGIYIGNGDVVHAPTAGDVVKVTPMAWMGSYSARRLV